MPGCIFLLTVILGSLTAPDLAGACSCNYTGDWVTVSAESPLVVRARAVERIPKQDGRYDVTVFKVLETLEGNSASTLRVWDSGGWLCRPSAEHFPVGSEWLLALDAPGAKQGVTPDHALSICGEHWLKVVGDSAVGNVCGGAEMQAIQRVPLDLLRHPARSRARFNGELVAGQGFEAAFGEGWVFRLDPTPEGWMVSVIDSKGADLSRLTPPLHGPNPRDISARHFRNSDNSGPNVIGAGNVNAPQETREFGFSHAVEQSIDPAGATMNPDAETIAGILCWGRGRLDIIEYTLTLPDPGGQPAFRSLGFSVELSWPTATTTVFKEMSPCTAEELALAEAVRQNLNLEGLRLGSVILKYDDGSKVWPDGSSRQGHHFWLLVWNWRQPRLGGEISARVYDDGEVVFQRHGP